ncbi:MAG: HAMP domain-containing sensor histidine kinase [Planctomycetota bacterium]
MIWRAVFAVTVVVLAWVTHALVTAQQQARLASDTRLAHFRMNSRVALLLNAERKRAPEEYEAFPTVKQQAYAKKSLQKIQTDEVIVRSRLITEKPEYIQLHFLVGRDGEIRSPQVPLGIYQELTVPETLSQAQFEANCRVLQTVQQEIDPRQLGLDLEKAQMRSRRPQQGWIADEPRRGSLEPLWVGERLYFVRRSADRLEGFLVDWDRLHDSLLEEVDDLFPEAALTPSRGEADENDLYAIPARFTPGAMAHGFRFDMKYVGIGLMWLLVFSTLGLHLRTLRKAERQRQFASHVTHELRSPLTTFSLYTDLLAEDMVPDEAKRRAHVETLREESKRMGKMIENVIAQSELEKGRARIEMRPVRVGELLEELRPSLEKLCDPYDVQLAVEPGGAADATITVDPAAVHRILTNLVENACKYGASPVSITAEREAGHVHIRVRDEGPGVPRPQAKAIFRAYDRGGRNETDTARGIGLGLPLSRELARCMHGDLVLESPTVFRLTF